MSCTRNPKLKGPQASLLKLGCQGFQLLALLEEGQHGLAHRELQLLGRGQRQELPLGVLLELDGEVEFRLNLMMETM